MAWREKTIIVILYILSGLLFLASLLSLLHNNELRYLKMLDFPRIQFFLAALLLLAASFFTPNSWRWHKSVFIGLNIGSMALNAVYLVCYLPLYPTSVPDSSGDESGCVSLMAYNVLMDNKEYDNAIAMIREADADILIAMETTSDWSRKLKDLHTMYPHRKESINEVGYGMVVYSKFKLSEVEKFYLNNEKVPSFRFKPQADNMPDFWVWATHPPPPVHFDNLPDNKGQKEQELLQIGEWISNIDQPVIVAGDLNDLAWGRTERQIPTGGKLNDVRVGRGFYNSFNAHGWFQKWPLDHFYVTEEFSLKDIKKLDSAGSDHYPIRVELCME